MSSPIRRFAPLNPELVQAKAGSNPVLQGVIFDFDGTLCEPQTYMFHQIREALDIDRDTDILHHVYNLPLPEREVAMQKVTAIEHTTMLSQVPQPGLAELMDYLVAKNIRKAICTRNVEPPVQHLLTRYLPQHTFDPIVTRSFWPPKPDPAGILHIASYWGLTKKSEIVVDQPGETVAGVLANENAETGLSAEAAAKTQEKAGETTVIGDASRLIMVGDSIDDMTAGRRAGAATVLLRNSVNTHLAAHEHTDLTIDRLDELVTILEQGFRGR